jgi:hypothetical protein
MEVIKKVLDRYKSHPEFYGSEKPEYIDNGIYFSINVSNELIQKISKDLIDEAGFKLENNSISKITDMCRFYVTIPDDPEPDNWYPTTDSDLPGDYERLTYEKDEDDFIDGIKLDFRIFVNRQKKAKRVLSKRADDEAGSKYEKERYDPKWQQVLIEAGDKKFTRKQIRDHYIKNAPKILKEISGQPVMIYINTGKTNQNVLKRNHNDKPIVFNDAKDIEYWADRRLLSIHRVFGSKTDLGFIDMDIHDGVPQNTVKKYAKEIGAKIKDKYGVNTTIYSSGSEQGIHIEFNLKEAKDIDTLRGELKDLCDELNEGYEGFTTGIVKGTGVRTDTTTLKNNGNIRVPYALHESEGGIKKPI